GKMFGQVVDDALDRQDANWDAGLVDHREVAIAALLHAVHGSADRFLGVDDYRVGRHDVSERRREGFAGSQDAAHEVAFGEDADDARVLADEQAADLFAAHQGDGVGDGLGWGDPAGRRWVQP